MNSPAKLTDTQFRGLDHSLDRGRALADGDIDADHVGALLVDDRVDRDRRLAGRAVADDELRRGIDPS